MPREVHPGAGAIGGLLAHFDAALWTRGYAASYEGVDLRNRLFDKENRVPTDGADTVYRSVVNETFRANNANSGACCRVEHVFAEQKACMGLFIRAIGTAPATAEIGPANPGYNIRRLSFLTRRAVA